MLAQFAALGCRSRCRTCFAGGPPTHIECSTPEFSTSILGWGIGRKVARTSFRSKDKHCVWHTWRVTALDPAHAAPSTLVQEFMWTHPSRPSRPMQSSGIHAGLLPAVRLFL
jgi:hypothetical protein